MMIIKTSRRTWLGQARPTVNLNIHHDHPAMIAGVMASLAQAFKLKDSVVTVTGFGVPGLRSATTMAMWYGHELRLPIAGRFTS
jgi:hypothetical protein